MTSVSSPFVPAVGYEVASCVLCFNVSSLSSRTIFATAGYLLKKSASGGGDEARIISESERSQIRFNARNLVVETVKVDGVECKFEVVDPLLCLSSKTSRDLSSTSAGLAVSLFNASDGELIIHTPGPLVAESISVEIDYSVTDGVTVFCLKSNKDDDMENHMYTNIGLSYSNEFGAGCGARCLFPCVDTVVSRHPLTIFVETEKEHIAIAPGTLVRTSPSTPTTNVHEFELTTSIPPYAVGLAVGPFVKIPHPSHPWFSTYVLPSRADRFQQIPAKIEPCINAILEYLNQKASPPASYSQVFIAGERSSEDVLPFANMGILSDDLMLDKDNEWVPPSAESDSLLAQCFSLACQWFGCGAQLGAASPLDIWVPTGLALFTALQSLRLSQGDACYYSILAKWTNRVRQTNARASAISVYHSKPGITLGRPLSGPMPYALPVDFALWAARGQSYDSTFTCKAGLMMHMLEQRASAIVFRDVLGKLARAAVIPRPQTANSQANVDNKPKLLSELAFLTLLKSRAGALAHDIDPTFISQWLRHNFIPKLSGEVMYNVKHNRVEVVVKQHLEENGRLYTGAVKVRVVETQGTWEYEKQIDNIEHRWVFECRSTKKKGKGGRKTRAEEERTEQWRNPEALNATKLLSLASSNKAAKRYWELNSPVRYVLLDPDSAWIMDLSWKQPEEFWLEMLHDSALKDNTSLQRFAIDQLGRHHFGKETGSHLRGASAVAALVSDSSKDDTVRVDAAFALLRLHQRFAPQTVNATSSTTGTWMGKDLIMQVFKQLYCDTSGEPLPFSTKDGQYAVRSALLEVISLIRARDGGVPDDTKDMIIDSVRLCDNAGNTVDDGPMLSGLALSTGNLLAGLAKDETNISASSADNAEAIRWIRSTLDFDAVSPSPRNRKKATIGCLEALCEMELGGVIPQGSTDFASYLTDPFWRSDSDVRLKAFECLVRLHIMERGSTGAKWMEIMFDVLKFAVEDPCRATRLKMLKMLLSAHAETVDRVWPELKGNKDHAGCFYPLTRYASDMTPKELEGARSIVNHLWHIINEGSAFDCGLRIFAHQLWRMIWKLDDVPVLENLSFVPDDLGHLEKWVEDAEREFQRDEKTMINLEELKNIQQRQTEMVKDQEAKRVKSDVPESSASTTTTTTTTTIAKNPPAGSTIKPSAGSAPPPPPPAAQDEDAIVLDQGVVQEMEQMEIIEEEEEEIIVDESLANGNGEKGEDDELFADDE